MGNYLICIVNTKLKTFVAITVLTFGLLSFSLLVPPSRTVNAQASLGYFASSSRDDACNALGAFGSQHCCAQDSQGNCTGDQTKTAQSHLSGTVQRIINILSVIVGVVAIIMILVSSFRFLTAGGDSAKAASARMGLIYAIIGIVVMALAQTIIHIVSSNAG